MALLGIINQQVENEFLAHFTLVKIGYYASSCNKNRTQSKFLLGWVLVWFPEVHAPPMPNSEALYPLIMGMLGIGTLRSFDKLKGTDTKSIGK